MRELTASLASTLNSLFCCKFCLESIGARYKIQWGLGAQCSQQAAVMVMQFWVTQQPPPPSPPPPPPPPPHLVTQWRILTMERTPCLATTLSLSYTVYQAVMEHLLSLGNLPSVSRVVLQDFLQAGRERERGDKWMRAQHSKTVPTVLRC